jgi:hypothetical protein
MAEKKKVEVRPAWSMDVMILSNINEISKAVSQSAIEVERGNLNEIFTFRATLKELYDNIGSLFDDDGVILDFFDKIDEKLSKYGFNLEEMPYSDFMQIKESLNLVKKVLFNARNDLFMKFVVMRTEDDKMQRYSLGRA